MMNVQNPFYLAKIYPTQAARFNSKNRLKDHLDTVLLPVFSK